VRSGLASVQGELLGVGQLLLAPGLGDDARRIALAGSKVTGSGTIDLAAVYDPQGKLVLALKAKESELAPAQQLPQELVARLKTGELALGPIESPQSGPRLLVALPIDVDGQRRGIVSTSLDLSPLCKLVGELGERRLSGSDGVLVVDESRTIVLAGDVRRVTAHENLLERGIFSAIRGNASFRQEMGAAPSFMDGPREMVGALETLPELGWGVVVQQPRAVAFRSIAQTKESVLAGALLAAILAALVGLLFSRQLARPIVLLAQETRKIAGRVFTRVPAELSERGDELGSLGRAFDQMAVDLRSSEASLITETKAKATLSRYLSADVVESILQHPDRMKVGGERREVTVLFADVVAFTRLSEQQPPEVVVQLLNELFTFATEIIHRRGGIIDKFIGDCVMAVWGTPVQHDDDPLRAVLAAEDLRRWVETANRKWRRQFGLEIRMAMGINTGQAVAGNIGSDKRLEYTVIGDAVNVAARLESLASPGQILLSESTRARLPEGFHARSQGEHKMRGRQASTLVFEVAE
ncbi:MAG: HAMP domain-containing protein, partial [Deltaproteobacteria bacterium]|nr:HAMP domain-containing protein [Deltaproteobacteria bacterium]